MADKRRRRPSIWWLPRWAWSSLGLFLVVTALQSLVGPHFHLLLLLLLPVLLASQGGAGPGLAMLAASLVAGTAIGVGMGHSASAMGVMTDGILFLGVGYVLVLRITTTQL